MMRKASLLLALVLLYGFGPGGVAMAADARFIGHLPQVTVELVGITFFPPTDKSRWWLPDGFPAPIGPYLPLKMDRRWRKYAGEKRLTFLVRFKHLPTEPPSYGQDKEDRYTPDASQPARYLPAEQPSYGRYGQEQTTTGVSWPPWGLNGNAPPDPTLVPRWEGHSVVDTYGKSVPDLRMWSAVLRTYSQSVDFLPGIATGAWETVITRKPDSAGKSSFVRDGQEWAVLFQKAKRLRSQADDSTQVTMALQWLDVYGKWNIRLVAVASDGSEHLSGVSYKGVKRIATAVFQNLPLSSIKEFRFQVRPFGWVEFQNISIQPGQKTVVTVVSTDGP